jgi:uncharacterized coiled-coil DUF342 family protein
MKIKEKIKQQIDEIDEQLVVWESKIASASAEAKAEYRKELKCMQSQRDGIKARFNELAEATEDKWKETQSFFSSATATFKEEFTKFKALFE